MKTILNEQTIVRILAIVALSCLTMLTYNFVHPENTMGRIPTMQRQNQQISPD